MVTRFQNINAALAQNCDAFHNFYSPVHINTWPRMVLLMRVDEYSRHPGFAEIA
jgi:hypothetical protein